MYVRLPGHVQRCGDLHLHAAQVQLGRVQVVVRPLGHLSGLSTCPLVDTNPAVQDQAGLRGRDPGRPLQRRGLHHRLLHRDTGTVQYLLIVC